MHPRATEFVERAAERYGVDLPVEEFSEGTKTAADAAEAIGCSAEQIASSLVFDADGDLVVVVASGGSRVDEGRLATELGVTDVAMADPGDVRERLGWTIGGVPPFCHDESVPTFVDESVLEHDRVWAAAGTPSAVFPIAPEALVEYANAVRTSLTVTR